MSQHIFKCVFMLETSYALTSILKVFNFPTFQHWHYWRDTSYYRFVHKLNGTLSLGTNICLVMTLYDIIEQPSSEKHSTKRASIDTI